MNCFKKCLSIAILFIFPLITWADSAENMLNQLLKNVQSMQAHFTQTMMDNKDNIIQKSQGNMALQRPGQFRWETTSPNAQLVVANGKRLWIYDPDLEQVVVRALSKQAGETPALLLSDSNPTLETDFKVSKENKSNSSLTWFLLKPKDTSSLFASIRMGFAGNELREMRLQDHLDHNTIIRFQNTILNKTISSSLFHFVPPKNVDVIDETKQ
jgi:outer membrane lipoprotein carrier protein